MVAVESLLIEHEIDDHDFIYVATDERADSKELEILRDAGSR
jgi:hypothetical protein